MELKTSLYCFLKKTTRRLCLTSQGYSWGLHMTWAKKCLHQAMRCSWLPWTGRVMQVAREIPPAVLEWNEWNVLFVVSHRSAHSYSLFSFSIFITMWISHGHRRKRNSMIPFAELLGWSPIKSSGVCGLIALFFPPGGRWIIPHNCFFTANQLPHLHLFPFS